MAKTAQKSNNEVSTAPETKNVSQEQMTNDNLTNDKNKKVISHPNDVANLVISQLNVVKTRKDDLETAIKGLAELTTQLVRAYASNAQTIQQMYKKIKELEEQDKK